MMVVICKNVSALKILSHIAHIAIFLSLLANEVNRVQNGFHRKSLRVVFFICQIPCYCCKNDFDRATYVLHI